MSEQSYHLTKEDIRKVESRTSQRTKHGEIPAGSTTAALQSIVDSQRPGPDQIAHTQANLPLPSPPALPASELPPVERSYDINKTGRGRGGAVMADEKVDELRQPVVKESAARVDGGEWHRETLGDTKPVERGV